VTLSREVAEPRWSPVGSAGTPSPRRPGTRVADLPRRVGRTRRDGAGVARSRNAAGSRITGGRGTRRRWCSAIRPTRRGHRTAHGRRGWKYSGYPLFFP